MLRFLGFIGVALLVYLALLGIFSNMNAGPYEGGPCERMGASTVVSLPGATQNHRVERTVTCEINHETGKLYWKGR